MNVYIKYVNKIFIMNWIMNLILIMIIPPMPVIYMTMNNDKKLLKIILKKEGK